MLIPLVTYPYLIRVVGIEKYGLVIFALAIVEYLLILVEFGFNISATRAVSIHRNNKNKLSEIVSSVLTIKIILFIISFLILNALTIYLPEARNYRTLFFLSMWICFYNVIFPTWYFQGIEQMKYITYITLASRLTFLGLIFIFILDQADYLFIPIIQGTGAILAGIMSLYIIFVKQKIKFRLPSLKNLHLYTIMSYPIFLSNLLTSLYIITNKVILGGFMGMKEVAYYDLAEKLSALFRMPLNIMGQAIYPKIAKDQNINFLLNSTRYILTAALIILLTGFLSSKTVIEIIGGNEMDKSITIFKILISSIIPVSVSLIFANLVLISWGYNKIYLKLRLITFGFYIILALISLGIGKATLINLAVLSLTTEILAAVLSIYYCTKLKVFNFYDFIKSERLKKIGIKIYKSV